MKNNFFNYPWVKKFWLFFALGMLAVLFGFFLISVGLFGKLPGFKELENPETSVATEVYSVDMVLLGKYYSKNRSNARYADLSPWLVKALIATEDARFTKHSGIDMRALARVVKGVITHNSQGGGSTLTQQLAKNLFPRKKLNIFQLIIRKFKEWIIAIRLERAYTKEEILAMYLNTVEFSDNAFGIKSAAKTYFNKPTDSLNIEEAAVLVGMLQAPYRYNPRLFPDVSQKRRNVVMAQMVKYGYLEQSAFDTLKNEPIALHFTKEDHIDGLAPHFRMTLREQLKEWCKKNKKPDGTEFDIYNDGLKVYTTIDSRLQKYAEEAVNEHLAYMQKIFFAHWKGGDPWRKYPTEWKNEFMKNTAYQQLKKDGKSYEEIDSILSIKHKMNVWSWNGNFDTLMSTIDSIKFYRMHLQAGFLVMDPETGFIKAWVGGGNFKYNQNDHVTTARQVGSTFKPFVYTVAIRDKGFSPCYQIPNSKIVFEKDDPRWHISADWSPDNADGRYGGVMTLKMGLAYSVNTITAYLMHEITPDAVIDLVHGMGITANIPPYPSICLGTPDIPLIQMVGAYTTYVNKGVYVEPIAITRIEDKNGNVLEEFTPRTKEVLDEQTAFVMIELMKNVINLGTGKRLRYMYNLKNEIVGKTGTTQNQSDGWFIGLTPKLIAGVWAGCDDRFVRFRSIRYGQGAALALPVWGRFFAKIDADSSLSDIDLTAKFFEIPEEERTIELDCSKYVSEYGSSTVAEYGSEFDKDLSLPEEMEEQDSLDF